MFSILPRVFSCPFYRENLEVLKKFIYIYDFDKNWQHEIQFEKRIPASDVDCYPICIAGEENSPGENCRGIGQYTISEDASDDCGFKVEAVNQILRKVEY